MALHCRVCGREGFDICPECSFRELNQQCWRCRMYLPMAEMQQFQGQWICPNCRMDMQEAERRQEKGHGGAGSGSSGGGPGDDPASSEMGEKLGECERCRRPTDVFYIVAGRKLCKFCFEQGKEYMARGPGASPTRIQIMRRKHERKSFFRKIIEFFLGKSDEPEYEIVEAEIIVPRKKEEPKPKKEGPKKHDWHEHKRE